jgi:hypothetical protein
MDNPEQAFGLSGNTLEDQLGVLVQTISNGAQDVIGGVKNPSK